MSRKGAPEIYKAGVRFVDASMRADDSMFTPGRNIWSLANLDEFHQRQAGNPQEGDEEFVVKLLRQLEGASADVYQLAGEIYFVYFLLDSSVGGDRKREQINAVLEKSPAPVSAPQELSDTLDRGLIGMGPQYAMGRPWQFQFLAEVLREFKRRDPAERQQLLSDPWAMKKLVYSLPISHAHQMRGGLLYLMFPDTFERIVVDKYKKLILAHWKDLVGPTSGDLDRDLLKLRTDLAPTYGTDLDFYKPDIEPLWNPNFKKPPAEPKPKPELAPKQRHWIFQANPERFDIDGALAALPDMPFLVNQHSGDIRPGDRVFVWRSGSAAAVVALATVLTPPAPSADDPAAAVYWRDKGDAAAVEMRSRLRFDRVLKTPVTKASVTGDPVLSGVSFFQVPRQTNIALTPEQAAALMALVEGQRGVVLAAEPVQRILFGPPGTGKTYRAAREAVWLVDGTADADPEKFRARLRALIEARRIVWVTFHPSYSYEDFVEGYRPVTENGQMRYEVLDGPFKIACSSCLPAGGATDPVPVVLVIDEINRADLSRVFGELITLLEIDKRRGAAEEREVFLPYSRKPFSVPRTLSVIGTMNTADRSLAVMDLALRRRFEFVELEPEPTLCPDEHGGISVKDALVRWNRRITALQSRDHRIGHSELMLGKFEDMRRERGWPDDEDGELRAVAEVMRRKVLPLLLDYFHDDWRKAEVVLGNRGLLKRVGFDDVAALAADVADVSDHSTFEIPSWWDPSSPDWHPARFATAARESGPASAAVVDA